MNIFMFSMGLGIYSVQLAHALAKEDCVTIALDEKDFDNLKNEYPGPFKKALFNIETVPHYRFPHPRKLLQVWHNYSHIKRHGTDLTHVFLSGTYPESYLSLWFAHKRGIPLVATVHDARLHPGDATPFHSILLHFETLSLCSQIIVHGRHIAEDLIRCFGIDEHKLNIIPHGNYDIHLQAENARPSADPRSGQVLLFGRMKKYKGLNILIQAAPIVAEQVPDLKIILAGKGEELDRFEPKLRGNPLFDIRNRYISAKEAAGLFASSSLVVIPYIEASQSGPLHLAYSWGRPVVATRVGAIPESIKHGREGLLVPPNNPEALAEAMIEILRNPTLASNLGHQGRIKADTALKWEGNISEMTRAVYQKALRTSSKDVCVGDTSHLNRLKRLKEYYRTLGHD